MADLSQFMDTPTIFKDKQVLTDQFIPTAIPFREKEIKEIIDILGCSLRGERPSNLFIYGTVGTGKSVVITHIKNLFEEHSLKNKKPMTILYLNCKKIKIGNTEYRVLTELCELLGKPMPVRGLSQTEIYKILMKEIEKRQGVCIIIFDEIDFLVENIGDDFLYTFTRINEELKKSKVSLIGITNKIDLIDVLDPRIKSSLAMERMMFFPYDALQLNGILQERAKLAFHSNALSDEVIPKCSALGAQEHGDARRSMELLRVSGEIAERLGEKGVTEKHVDTAEEKIDYDNISESVRTTSKQAKIVLLSIFKLNRAENDIETGDVYTAYEKLCDETGTHILSQQSISNIISELDMLGIINARIISFGRGRGRTRKIHLVFSPSVKTKIEKILKDALHVSD